MSLPEQYAQYEAMFHRLMRSRYKNVPGILAVESPEPGPTAAILACVHGNEPAGLGAIDYLLSDLQLARGRVLFVLVNFAAAQNYFSAADDAGREKARYIDRNMNRLPERGGDWLGTVEGMRLGQLWPVLQEIDGGVLDLHSTSADAPPMLIAVDDTGCEAAECPTVPFTHIIQNIHRFIRGKFMIELCDNAPLKLLAECGQHHCPDASARAVEMSLAFLRKLEMIAPAALPPEESPAKHCYRVKAALRLPEGAEGFRLLRPVAPFERLEKGQEIASNGRERVTAPDSGYAVMCPQTQGALDCSEAVLFLCDKDVTRL